MTVISVRSVRTIYWLVIGMCLIVGPSCAQKPRFFPLQQHKLLYADTVHREAIQKKDSLLLAEAYYLYGKTYEGAGDMLTAQRWFLKSLAILEPRGDSFNLCRLYVWLGRSEFSMRNYPETRRYALLALATARRIGDKRALNLSYGLMTGMYEFDWSMGGKRPGLPTPRTDSAAYYQRLGRALFELSSHKDSLVKLDYYLLIGRKQWNEKRDTSSLAYFRKALDVAIRKNEPTWQIRIMRDMAQMYLEMNKPAKAWQMLQKTNDFLRKSPFKDSHSEWHHLEELYRYYYTATGDWRQAYDHAEKLHELERNTYMSDRDGAITRLSLEYETEKKEALLKAQQKELGLRTENLNINQRFLWTVSALLLLSFGTSILFFRLYRQNQRISNRNEILVREQNHRVKNNLQVVTSLLHLQANRLTDEVAKKAVGESLLRVETMTILHRRLYDTDTLDQVNLAEFIPELTDSVLLAFGYGYIQPTYELEPINLSADQALPVGLLLNELITNACKYAFPTKSDPNFSIACRLEREQVILVVCDNGLGFSPEAYSKVNSKIRTSFGMRLIQLQADQLRGTYQFNCEEGTLFTLKFKPSYT